MSKLLQLAFLLFVATGSSGCGALFASAGVESRPGDYHVNGYTSDPVGAIAVSSQAYVQQYNAETYRRAVESGRAYPYMGGMGGDYWYYYRGVMPAQPVVPAAPHVAVPPASTSTAAPGPTSSAAPPVTGDALAEAREARRRADAALRMHARLRDQMQSEEAAAVPPTTP